jgi:hypothetical protein
MRCRRRRPAEDGARRNDPGRQPGAKVAFSLADALLARGPWQTGYDAQVMPSRFVNVKRCEKPIAAERIAGPCLGEESPVGDQILKAQLPLIHDGRARVSIGGSRRTVWMRLKSSMENLIWVIIAIGVLVGADHHIRLS